MKKVFALLALVLTLGYVIKPGKLKQGEQKKEVLFTSSSHLSESKLISNPDTLKPPVIRIAGPAAVVQSLPPVVHLIAPPHSPVGIPHFTTYNTEQGLALSSVRCGCKDRAGNLWFGTEGGGVSRYDGKSFTNFTTTQGLANNVVKCMMEDRSGNIWFGTVGGGVSRYDGISFTTFTTAQGLGNNTVWDIKEDKMGMIWFGTEDGGVSRYDGKSFTNYTTAQGLVNNSVRCIMEDKKGHMWFGTENGGVCRYNGKVFTNFTSSLGFSTSTVWSMMEDKKGRIWFATEGSGVSKYDGKFFTNYTTEQGLANNHVWSIKQDNKGNLWFGTQNGGVSRYDGITFTNYTTTDGLAANTVFSITEDKTGDLWFGTETGGLSKYDGDSFINFTTAQGLPNNVVLTILEDRNKKIWFGTYGGGVSCFDGKSIINYTTAQGLSSNSVFCITEDKAGNIWFGTEGGGIDKYDGKSFTNYKTTHGLPNNIILSIKEDKEGNLWCGTYGFGLSKFDGKSFTNYTTAQGLVNNNVFNIMQDRTGNMWFATVGGGVSKYDGKIFTNYTTAHGLSNNTVWSITEDKKGNLWFATAEGLCEMSPLKKNSTDEPDGVKFTTYSVNNGLPDNFITNVLQLPNNKMVVGTNKGIAVFDPLSSLDATGRLANLEIYNSGNGYPVKDVNAGQNAMYLDSKSNIWVGTGDEKTGIARIDYSAINRNANPPAVVIQKVLINEQNICWYDLHSASASNVPEADSAIVTQQEMMTYGKSLSQTERTTMRQRYDQVEFDGIEKFYPLPKNLVLPYESNNVSFEFNAIEPSKPHLVNYQYILEGYDKDWSPVVQKTSATFGHISEGSYTFKLKAQSPEGIWSEPVVYTFKVLPQWYRTPWAYVMYSLFIAGALYIFYKWRTAAFFRERELLEEKVKIRTEQMFNQAKVAENQRAIAETQKQLVQEKVKEITDSIHYAKRIQTALLTSQEYMKENIPGEHFVLFKPKDIVSGDFYWALQHKNKLYIANCDCTGHGVPGAFMSMLNISFLNKIILERGITEPHEIINHVRDEIISALNPKGSKEVSTDGMDAVLCCFDFEHMKLTFASANNALWLVRDQQLTEFKVDKMPIGKYSGEMSPFTLQTIELKKGDIVYTSTDGFHAQWDKNDKRLMKRNLKELLLSIHTRPMQEQKDYLDQFFENWKEDTEQVDDVCIIGIKI